MVRREVGGTNRRARWSVQRAAGLDWSTVLPPLFAALVALGLGSATLLRGVAFWDTAELQTIPPLLGTAHPTGFPTYVILGWLTSIVLQPFGEPALRMNLLSTLCVASAAGLTAVLVGRLTGLAWLALASGIVLATTPIAWSMATHADTHALHLALVALLLVLLVDWERLERARAAGADRRLVAASVVFALALGNHTLTILLALPVALYVLTVDPRILGRPRLVGACLLALALPLIVLYAELPLRAGVWRAPLVYGHPETWNGFWDIVLAAQFQGSLGSPLADVGGKAATVLHYLWLELGPLIWFVPGAFMATVLRHPRYALLSGTAAALTVWFAASYENAEIERYYLGPTLIALTWLAVLAGLLVDSLNRRVGGPRHVLALLLAALLLVPTVAVLPQRWRSVDLSQERQAADWLNAVLDPRVIPPNAVVVSWWSYSTPLWYAQQIQGRRPDIAIVDDRTRLDEHLGGITDVIDANLGRRPVVAIQYRADLLAQLATRYRLTPLPVPGEQPVYLVEGLLGSAR